MKHLYRPSRGIKSKRTFKKSKSSHAADDFAKPDVIYERLTGSVQYVVSDPVTRRCAIIDPVLDFDEKSGVTATYSADRILLLHARA
jgi:hypothetical protein